MSVWLRAASFALLALWISGCASRPVPFDKTTAGEIKTVGLIAPGLPERPTAVIGATVGRTINMFSGLGFLVDAGVKADRNSRLAAALSPEQLAPDKTFTDGLVDALTARGYSVQVIPATRPSATGFLERYPDAGESKVDAYLDVVAVSYGYTAAGASQNSPYRPSMNVRCQLVRASDSAVLMQDSVIYNPLGRPGKVVIVPPDPEYAFADMDALEASPGKASEGLHVAFTETAKAVGKLLH